jgi:pantoate--beta-alanine ligase
MKITGSIKEVRDLLAEVQRSGKTIGLVPTMGYLHEGHLSLARAARNATDFVVMSIFVNPTQFGAGEDYHEYPRDLERDALLAEKEGVDLIFAPDVPEMYPEGYVTYVNVEQLTSKLCGKSRPVHFRGVTTVVTKLFNIVQPDKAFFGQKDAQQAVVVKRMTADLNIPVEIITCPIVREADGLALSSRNSYLNSEERQAALVLSRSLTLAEHLIAAGERDPGKVLSRMRQLLEAEPLARIDYVEICRADDLAEVDRLAGRILIALAVRIGKTRLIDNTIVEV